MLFSGVFFPEGVGGIPLFCGWKEGIMSEKVLDELAEWIDPRVIADAILQELESQEASRTIENGKTIWLDVLENGLPDALRSSVKAHALM